MDTIGGFTLIRLLGSGSRADVHLGVATESIVAGGHSPNADAALRRSVAVKLFRAETPTSSIGREAEALARARSPHLLTLSDLALDGGGRVALILPRLRTTSLASLLTERSSLEPGEAVTILAPLAAAVAELHRVGVAHGGIRCSRVLFDASGAPVLTGFGSAVLVGSAPHSRASPSLPPALATESREFARDVDDFAALARTVVEAVVVEAQTVDAAGLLGAVAEAPTPQAWLDALPERLFAWSAPLPVDFDGGRPSVGVVPTRGLAPVRRGELPLGEGPDEPAGRNGTRRAQRRAPTSRLPPWVETLLSEWITALTPQPRGSQPPDSRPRGSQPPDSQPRGLQPRTSQPQDSQAALSPHRASPHRASPRRASRRPDSARPVARGGAVEAIRSFLAPVRRRVWWTAGVVALMLLAGLVLIPESESEQAEALGITADEGPTGQTPADRGADPPAPAEGGPPASPEPSGGDTDAIVGDDPVAAARSLLRLRATCLAERSIGCLSAVHQAGSAALDADRQVIAGEADELLAGLDIESAESTLVQRLGDSALLDISLRLDPTQQSGAGAAPVAADVTISALLVKGSAGWRVRDLIVGGGVP